MSRRDDLKKTAQRLETGSHGSGTGVATTTPEAATPRTVRITVDLLPALHRELGEWCMDAARELNVGRVWTQEVIKTLLRELMDDETLSATVQTRIADARRRRE